MAATESSSKCRIVLLLFMGPSDSTSSLGFHCRKLGMECDEYDVLNGPTYDVVDNSVWETLLKRIQSGYYSGLFAAPPSDACLKSRGDPGEPPALRGVEGAGRYGYRQLSVSDKALVRLHNLMAVRAAQAFTTIMKLGGVAGLVTPALRKRKVSLLRLDEYDDLLNAEGVKHIVSVQCPFGAPSARLTSWLLFKLDMQLMPTRCSHAMTKWYSTADNSVIMARHPPVRWSVRYTAEPCAGSSCSQSILLVDSVFPTFLNRFVAAALVQVVRRGPCRGRLTLHHFHRWAPKFSTGMSNCGGKLMMKRHFKTSLHLGGSGTHGTRLDACT